MGGVPDKSHYRRTAAPDPVEPRQRVLRAIWGTRHETSGPQTAPPRGQLPNGRPQANAPTPPQHWRGWALAIACVFAVLLLFHAGVKPAPTRNFTYTGFVNEVAANKVSTATITSAGAVSGKLDSGEAYTSQIPIALDDTALTPLLLDHKVQVTGTNASATSVLGLAVDLLTLLFFVGVLVWFVRRSRKQLGGGLGGIMSIGRSKAKVYDEDKPTTRFADIAGYEGSKAEVMEVVDFLKVPQALCRGGCGRS